LLPACGCGCCVLVLVLACGLRDWGRARCGAQHPLFVFCFLGLACGADKGRKQSKRIGD
jgi:hypothetical protein